MRSILVLLPLLCGAPFASAEIVAVYLKGEDAAVEYQKQLVPFMGGKAIIGEPKAGIQVDFETGNISYINGPGNELFVLNPKKPESYPYVLDDGNPVATNKVHVLELPKDTIQAIVLIDRDQTLPGITSQFIAKEEQLKELRNARRGLSKDSTDWHAAQHQLVAALEAQEQWLLTYGYSAELKKLRKELKKESKAAAAIPQALKYAEIIEAIRFVDPPEALTRISKEEFDGRHEFNTIESEHFRIHYLTKGNGVNKQVVSDRDAKRIIELAERALDGFRAEFVTPYVGDDYKDTIPEGLLATWFFAPESNTAYLRYAKELFGFERRAGEESIEVTGESTFGGEPARQRYLWRMVPLDLDGIILHQVGHVLSMFHYGGDGNQIRQDWLEEATANSLANRYLGRFGAVCLGMQGKQKYLGRESVKPGRKVQARGRQAAYDLVALSQAGPIQALALKRLYDMGDPDLAKAWSFYEYVIANEGKPGQQYLRAAGEFSRDMATMVQNWRAATAKFYGVDEREALNGIENRWREFVEKRQNADD